MNETQVLNGTDIECHGPPQGGLGLSSVQNFNLNENPSYSQSCNQIFYYANQYHRYLPSYDDEKFTSSLSFGINSSRHLHRSRNTYNFVEDRLPELRDLIDRPCSSQSEYSVLRKHYTQNSSEEPDPRKLQNLDITIQLFNQKTRARNEILEFLQGDFIEGIITLTNNSSNKVPYAAFLVSLQGECFLNQIKKFKNKPKKRLSHRFFPMIDYGASNALTNFDCDGDFSTSNNDANYHLKSKNKYLKPHNSRRIAFKFRLPQKLLNCVCEEHNIPQHCELLPTFYYKPNDSLMSRFIFEEPKTFQKNSSNNCLAQFGMEASITYSIEAILVGDISDYKRYLNFESIDVKKKTYKGLVIIRKEHLNINVLPRHNLEDLNDSFSSLGLYTSLMEKAKQSIAQMAATKKENSMHQLLTISKHQQLFQNRSSDVRRKEINNNPVRVYSISKKLFSWRSRSPGTIRMATTARAFSISSTPLCVHPNLNSIAIPTSTLNIPLDLKFSPSGPGKSYKFPKIIITSLKMISLTYFSRNFPIPIDNNYDLLFGEKKFTENKNEDPFENNIRQPARQLLYKLAGFPINRGDSPLIQDLSCLAELSYKFRNLSTHNALPTDTQHDGISMIVSSTRWEPSVPHGSFGKTINIDLHFKNMKSTLNELNWVPDFQSCFMGRMNFIKICCKIHNAGDIIVNLPLKIE